MACRKSFRILKIGCEPKIKKNNVYLSSLNITKRVSVLLLHRSSNLSTEEVIKIDISLKRAKSGE